MFYMTLIPTTDEIVVVSQLVDQESGAVARKEITARVWKGTTQSGNPVEVAVLQFLEIEELDERILKQRLEELHPELADGVPPG